LAKRADILFDPLAGHRLSDDVAFRLAVINAGPASARHVTCELVLRGDGPLGLMPDHSAVAVMLERGQARTIELRLPLEHANSSAVVELEASWLDDAGMRRKRLALVYDDELIELA
jgi:hypothetical protein